MTSNLNALIAAEHVADLRREAEHQSARQSVHVDPRAVVLRMARPGDERTLHVLAELDEEPELVGETILALIDDKPVAAISLHDGRVVSDPFVRTADAVSLLRLRARYLPELAPRQPRRRWRPRFV